MVSPQNSKSLLRRHFQLRRRALSPIRRCDSEEEALRHLQESLGDSRWILSYSNIHDEFNMESINSWLAVSGKLVLPKVEGKSLLLYHVEAPERQLQKGAFGILEPVPSLCRAIAPHEISLAFVPGLAFDASYHRLGWGGGYYDRLLPQLNASAFGLGFKEQLSPDDLPVQPADVALNGLMLF